MACTVHDITHYLETIAPPAYQADYDNSGLQVGNPDALLTGVLITLDITDEVLQEAQEKNCNLVIAHHPLIFTPIKKITTYNPITHTIMRALKDNINLYALHTNIDHIAEGISKTLADKLRLTDLEVLAPLPDTHHLLTTYLPTDAVEKVKKALFQAGAGTIDDYQACSFASKGEATFQPKNETNPHIDTKNQCSYFEETCLRTIVPTHHKKQVIQALIKSHPHQKPSYHFQTLSQHQSNLGAGMIGSLPEPLTPNDFLQHVKTQLNLTQLRYTLSPHSLIQRVALCGGSGSSLITHAYKAKAHAFITADLKYHQFFQALNNLMLLDIGHYESEVGFKSLIYKLLSKKFYNIALQSSTTYTNPIRYQ